MQKKYSFLFFAARVLRILAWVVLVVGVVLFIVLGVGIASGTAATTGVLAGIAGGIAGFFVAVAGAVISFLAWVLLLATREILFLLMDVEENTRNTAERVAKESS